MDRKALAGVFPSNKDERRVLIHILGYCGILETSRQPGFFAAFQPCSQRTYPPVSKTDWGNPVRWWRGADGVNSEALAFWFPGLASSN